MREEMREEGMGGDEGGGDGRRGWEEGMGGDEGGDEGGGDGR